MTDDRHLSGLVAALRYYPIVGAAAVPLYQELLPYPAIPSHPACIHPASLPTSLPPSSLPPSSLPACLCHHRLTFPDGALPDRVGSGLWPVLLLCVAQNDSRFV
eukprot:GHVU01077874.1.p3 GENE.GHVU01077874.1~~GHVU01077874.1.p3  ORF type:complete len:104 (+),score=1.99 GHVU01077874.1:465-776(+)